MKGRGGGVAIIYNKLFKVSHKSALIFYSFEKMVLNMTLIDGNNNHQPFVLATIYRSSGHHTDFLREFADFLSKLVVTIDRALIVRAFNIHIDNTKHSLGLAFMDILNSFCVRQSVTGPTHNRKHTLDLILSCGLDINNIDILPQSDSISDHSLVSYRVQLDKNHISHHVIY